MKTPIILMSLGLLTLTACQTISKPYDGVTGYQIETTSTNAATLQYTLSGHTKQEQDLKKMQSACQDVLGKNKTYHVEVIHSQEIAAPAIAQEKSGLQLGNSRTSIGFSNSPNNNHLDEYATRQALEAKPSTLKVIRFNCHA